MRIALAALLAAVSLPAADWRTAVTFRATFDHGLNADRAAGDPVLYTAPNYDSMARAVPGLADAPVELAPTAGRHGGALRFVRKNNHAVFFKGERNVPFAARGWSGTLSLWLRVDPDKDLEPGYCDPIQLTDKAYNDSALWVDFTRDDHPRHFRLGVFGTRTEWNPKNLDPDKNPAFEQRLVRVAKPPFSAGAWTHVAIAYSALGGGQGSARLYVNGKLAGTTPAVAEAFHWDPATASIRLGLSYIGLMDEVTVFGRPLTAEEIAQLYRADTW